jgi:hypothetical protein
MKVNRLYTEWEKILVIIYVRLVSIIHKELLKSSDKKTTQLKNGPWLGVWLGGRAHTLHSGGPQSNSKDQTK